MPSDNSARVFKKRVGGNLYRSIILSKGGQYWVYVFMFAKQDRANIDDAELREFRKLAHAYEQLTTSQLARLLSDKDLTEICHGDQTQVQE